MRLSDHNGNALIKRAQQSDRMGYKFVRDASRAQSGIKEQVPTKQRDKVELARSLALCLLKTTRRRNGDGRIYT